MYQLDHYMVEFCYPWKPEGANPYRHDIGWAVVWKAPGINLEETTLPPRSQIP
jgi:hypothetical protein